MYELSEAAANDIELLLEKSLLDFGLLQTTEYYESLQRCLESLGENPEMGIAADDIRPGYRSFPHESHVVYYQPQSRSISVVRVLHKRMQASKHLG